MAEKFYKILINTQSKTEEETKLVQEVIKKANES